MLSQVGQSSQALVKRREMEAELHPFSVLKTFLLGDFFLRRSLDQPTVCKSPGRLGDSEM